MKVGIITKPNQKGQIVIPKPLRDALNITQKVPLNLVIKNGGIYIQPLSEFGSSGDTESSYLKILEKTQGAWKAEDWGKLAKKRRKIELAASARRKKSW